MYVGLLSDSLVQVSRQPAICGAADEVYPVRSFIRRKGLMNAGLFMEECRCSPFYSFHAWSLDQNSPDTGQFQPALVLDLSLEDGFRSGC